MKKGFKHTIETRKKLSLARLGKKIPFKYRKEPITKQCKYCGIIFKHKPCWGDRKKYCSKKCFNATISDRMKRDGSPNWKGGKNKCIDCQVLLSTRTSKRCQKCFHKIAKGENHGSWRGGITSENQKIRGSTEIKLWRKSVFERDNWTCQKYKILGGELVAHHIKNFKDFPELRTAIDNGITLSKKAHLEFHKRYGNRYNMQEQIKEFLSVTETY